MFEYLTNEDKLLISEISNYSVDNLINEIKRSNLRNQIFSTERLVFDNELNKKGLQILRCILSRRINDARQDLRSNKYDKFLLKEFRENGCLISNEIFSEKDVVGETLKVNDNYVNILQMTLGDDTIPEYKLLPIQNMPTPASISKFDPQTCSHFDTFHPATKVWVYLSNVTDENAPLHFSPGTHHNTKHRLEFMYKLSCRLSSIKEGDFSDINHEFDDPKPIYGSRFTTIFVDVTAFHKRGIGTPGKYRLSARGNPQRKNPFRGIHE